ncbi:phage replisome organizer N-terminal domain-containing protein [Enterococcus gallinarum]|uniref:phage replisome organizer N-terminal domain-containing protein n=1 Tax=Enterococcus gallinarum TaxID=1353 RepID=UPI001C6087DF|nr:phage replisome organizer N-terminal domain-containing protein [Enterococcus gallinarum]MBW5474894.1 replication protein [Enterococcus gallinarum]UJA23301.1 replication protein [Enterococcus gallinarum]
MAEISWIKLSTGLPDNKKIKRIRKLPEGDKVILFWVFLLARAGESNQSGGIFLTDTMPYQEEDLAADFDFNIEFVQFALITLEKYSMITRYQDILFIKNWEEYQSIEGLEKVREQNRIRQARYKEKQRQLTLGNVTANVSGNAEVTESNATDIDKELDKERDIDKEKIPYSDIIKYLNEATSKSFKVTQKWKDLIKARWNEGQRLDDFKKVIDVKTNQWLNNQEMNKYLRPATLFGNKFDDYLNEYRPQVNSSISDEIAESQRRLLEAYEQ